MVALATLSRDVITADLLNAFTDRDTGASLVHFLVEGFDCWLECSPDARQEGCQQLIDLCRERAPRLLDQGTEHVETPLYAACARGERCFRLAAQLATTCGALSRSAVTGLTPLLACMHAGADSAAVPDFLVRAMSRHADFGSHLLEFLQSVDAARVPRSVVPMLSHVPTNSRAFKYLCSDDATTTVLHICVENEWPPSVVAEMAALPLVRSTVNKAVEDATGQRVRDQGSCPLPPPPRLFCPGGATGALPASPSAPCAAPASLRCVPPMARLLQVTPLAWAVRAMSAGSVGLLQTAALVQEIIQVGGDLSQSCDSSGASILARILALADNEVVGKLLPVVLAALLTRTERSVASAEALLDALRQPDLAPFCVSDAERTLGNIISKLKVCRHVACEVRAARRLLWCCGVCACATLAS